MFPSPDAAGVENRLRAPAWKTLANTPALQAIADLGDRSISIVFWKPGKLGWDGIEVSAEHPCVILLDKDGDSLVLSAADPSQKLPGLQFKISGSWKGDGVSADGKDSRVKIALPKEGMAGSTVSVRLARP